MVNKQFEAYKLKREIMRSGTRYEFRRNMLNKFGEPIGEPMVVGRLSGLYHEENGNIQITTGETTRSRSKKVPMILCLYDDAASLGRYNPDVPIDGRGVMVGDNVIINGKTFVVTGVVNISEWNIIADISLEVVDNVVQNRPKSAQQ